MALGAAGSGAIEGRPVLAWIVPKRGESARSAVSTLSRIGRSGWSFGIRLASGTQRNTEP